MNAQYLISLNNVIDKKQFMYLANEVYPEDSLGLYNAYLDATERPPGYVIVEEYPPVVYSDKRDDASDVELPGPSRAQGGRTEIT